MRFSVGFVAAMVAMAMISSASAQDKKTSIRFILDWKYQGIHSWYFLAKQKGYFDREGLDVTIDQGDGSGAAVTHVMSGPYNAGFGDVNAIILNTAAGRAAPVMVYMIYSSPPFVINTLTNGPIKTLKDLEHHSVGAPAGSAALKLFQIVAKANGLDATTISTLNMAPNLMEQMLLTHQVDSLLEFNVTSYVNFIAMKVDPDKDIGWLYYKDLGINLYSNGVIVSTQLAKESPKAVAGLVRAINLAIHDAVKNPDEAIAALAAQETLINRDFEKRRMLYAFKTLIMTPEEAEVGLGDIKDDRMQSAIGQVAQAFELPRQPAVTEIFDRSFLPPKSERLLTRTP